MLYALTFGPLSQIGMATISYAVHNDAMKW